MENNNYFEPITTGKYSFIEDTNVRSEMRESGKRKVFFVEGIYDKLVFNIVFEGKAYCFIPIGNCRQVRDYVEKCFKNLSKESKFYGIVDRDFFDDEERIKNMKLSIYGNRLWIHEKNTLENYFIEEDILSNYTLTKHPFDKDIKDLILEAFKNSVCIQAGNNYNIQKGIAKLPNTTPNNLEILKKKCNIIDKTEDEELLMKYYEKLNVLSTIEEFNKYINGKIFFVQFSNILKNMGKAIQIEEGMQKNILAHILIKIKDKHTEMVEKIESILI